MRTSVLVFLVVVSSIGCGSSRPASRSAAAELSCDRVALASDPLATADGPLRVSALRATDLRDWAGEDDDLPRREIVGARIAFPAPEGWSRAAFERRLLCWRDGAPAAAADSVFAAGSDLRVRSAHGRVLVDVTSRDRRVAREVWAAARRLGSDGGEPVP